METEYRNLFSIYLDKVKSMFYFEEKNIESRLFPSIVNSQGKIFDSEDVCPLTMCIQNTWGEHSRRNLLLVGDGGAGKTTNLLQAYFDLSADQIDCAFIPLMRLEGIENATIEHYFREYIFKRNVDFDDFLNSLDSDCIKYGQPRFVLFLDGWNEVYVSRNQLYRDLQKWLSYNNVQVVMSTREGFSGFPSLLSKAMEPVRMKPLDYDDMRRFVKEKLPDTDVSTLSDFVLGNPMLLNLFMSNQEYIDEHIGDSLVMLRQEGNPGSVLWNYMQLQILKYNELLIGLPEFGYEQCNLITIINSVLPYISWDMEKRQRLSISCRGFGDLLYNAYAANTEVSKRKLDEYMFEQGICGWEFDENKVRMTILDKLSFFKKSDDMVEFRHQYYRDFLAAFYYYTNLFHTNEDKEKAIHIWNSELISFNTMKLFCDLLSDSEIVELTTLCKHTSIAEVNHAIDNLFQVYRIVYEGNLSKCKFVDLDLRGIYLNQYKLVCNEEKAAFVGCKLGNATFYGDGHHGRVITAAYSSDQRYIASSCTSGEVKIWKSGSGKKIYELKEPSSVYALCWISPDSFVYATIVGECFHFNIRKLQKELLFKTSAIGIKSLFFREGTLYAGCTNGDLLSGTIYQVNPIVHIQHSIVKIISDGQVILFLDSAGNVWFLRRGDRAASCLCASHNSITDISCTADSVVACRADGITLWWKKGELAEDCSCTPTMRSVDQSFKYSSVRAYENKVFLGTQNGEILIWDVDKDSYFLLPDKHIGWVRTVSYSDQEKEIASAGSDGKVILWDMNSMSPKTEKSGIPNMVLSHQYLRESSLLVASSNDCKVIIWDLEDCVKRKELLGHNDWVRSIATGNQHDIIASGGTDGKINIWEISDRSTLNADQRLIYQGNCRIMSLEWNNDDSFLVGALSNGEVYLWNITRENNKTKLLYKYESSALCASFSPSGHYVASSDMSGHLSIHVDGQTITQKISEQPVRQICWSDDGLYLYACCLEGCIIKYRFENEKLSETARIQSYGARSICSDEGMLWFGGVRQELWKTDMEQESILVDKYHLDYIDYISKTSQYISTSGHDGSIILREKSNTEKTTVLRLIPGINISGCEFVDCDFEYDELRAVLTMNGGLIRNVSAQ